MPAPFVSSEDFAVLARPLATAAAREGGRLVQRFPVNAAFTITGHELQMSALYRPASVDRCAPVLVFPSIVTCVCDP